MALLGPTPTRLGRAAALSAVLVAAGCANREYVTSNLLIDIERTDPDLTKIRVYPSATFVAVYGKLLGEDVAVSGQIGSVQEDFRGQRVEIEVRRDRPGAVVGVESLDGEPLVWVTFDDKCTARDCAYGFVRTDDGLYRLFHVPLLPGFSEPAVYRKRIAPRKSMERTKIYSKSKGASVYFTMRGLVASIAIEVKKRKRVEIETIREQKGGVRPGG